MPLGRAWSRYRSDYRARELKVLAGWIQAGISGSVVGSAGVGKSNLLGFIGNRPDIIQSYLSKETPALVVVPVDLNNLPVNDTGTLYRVILRSFYESRAQLDDTLQEIVTSLYLDNRAASDPFLPQSALRELLLDLQKRGQRVVLILDRFDSFCETVSPEMTGTLRGLRDSFKDTICYIVGMRREVAYLANPTVLGELYELLDMYVCWVQPMSLEDAEQLIIDETSFNPDAPGAEESRKLLVITGKYPSLLKAACHVWLNDQLSKSVDWTADLVTSPTMRYRLERIRRSLTLAEQQVLGEIARRQEEAGGAAADGRRPTNPHFDATQEQALRLLSARGLVNGTDEGWEIAVPLLATYIDQVAVHSPGSIWFDEGAGRLYQGRAEIDNLTPLEHTLLSHLVRYPQVRHTYTDLIEAAWPADTMSDGVSTEALYQVVRGLRRKIEPAPSRPQYIVNWRGTSAGGPSGKNASIISCGTVSGRPVRSFTNTQSVVARATISPLIVWRNSWAGLERTRRKFSTQVLTVTQSSYSSGRRYEISVSHTSQARLISS